MNFLITAGPTREYLDSIRFLSNPSTGKMGYALAAAARQLGHQVVLISGPTNLPVPQNVKLIKVTTARQMLTSVKSFFNRADCLVMSAAVGDYRPAHQIKGKLRKSQRVMNLKLVRNPDIFQEVAPKKKHRVFLGFALEPYLDRQQALHKLSRKKLDYIVLNTPKSFGQDRTRVEVLNQQGLIKSFKNASKSVISRFLIKLVEKQFSISPEPILVHGRREH